MSDSSRRWIVLDADGKVLGRLATAVARHLMGKTKPIYTPFLVVTGLVGWAAMLWAARGLRVPPVAELEAAALFLGDRKSVV